MSAATSVALVGAGGRMGRTIGRALLDSGAFRLSAGVDPGFSGRPLSELVQGADPELAVLASLEELSPGQAEIAVDFTIAQAALSNLAWCARNGLHAVCGTTGLGEADLAQLRELFEPRDAPNCVLAPNFSLSAVLAMRFAELAAPYFDGVEVIELHHDQKADAPSGTALDTAARIAAARARSQVGEFAPDPTTRLVLEGARGAVGPGGVHVHSVRLRGLVAHEEILFGSAGQSLTIRQDSYDRSSFAAGVLLAASRVAETPGFTLGLDRFFGF